MFAPATWNSGMATSTASPASNFAHCPVAERKRAEKLLCVSCTPLGRPVVPEV